MSKRKNSGKLFLIIRRICFSEKPPYLLTLLLAFLIFTLNNIINHELESPIVCYTLEDIKSQGSVSFEKEVQNAFDSYKEPHSKLGNLAKSHERFIIKNISLNSLISQLTLTIKFKSDEGGNYQPIYFFDEKLVPVSPAGIPAYVTGDPIFDEHHNGQPRNVINFKITNFQPDSKYYLEFYVARNPAIEGQPTIYLDSGSTVRLKEQTWKEFLLINRFLLNICLFGVILTSLIIYLYVSFKTISIENSNNIDNG